MQVIGFDSHGVRCEADWYDAGPQDLAGPAGRPCVVMAHGFGTTRDCGLAPFAERFAAAGCDVLAFDYRGFGGSDTPTGAPRQDVDHRRHREDYHAAVAYARSRPGTDPDRVAVWGTSYSGGHVVAVAAKDPGLAAVVSQGAAMDGRAALTGRGKRRDPSAPPTSPSPRGSKGPGIAGAVARDVVRRVTRRPPCTIAFLGEPGSGAMISGPGAVAFERLTGPSFRNEMCARGVLRIPFNRPVAVAHQVSCPTLLVVAEYDEVAPSTSVHEVARRLAGPVEVESFDTGHFEIYEGPVFEESVSAQVSFLRRALAG